MDNYKQKLFLLCALLFGCVFTSVGVECFTTPEVPIKIEAPPFVEEQSKTASNKKFLDKQFQNDNKQVNSTAPLAKTTNVDIQTKKISETININTASLEELDTLPGVGPAIAKRIVEFRSTQPFTKIEDIMLVKGIGKKKFARLRERITVE